MRTILIGLALALAGCQSQQQAPAPEPRVVEVQVPVAVPCKITPVAWPAFAVDSLPLGAAVGERFDEYSAFQVASDLDHGEVPTVSHPQFQPMERAGQERESAPAESLEQAFGAVADQQRPVCAGEQERAPCRGTDLVPAGIEDFVG